MAEKRPSKNVLWLVIVAAPVALALETGMRLVFFPDDFYLVREFLNPFLTPVAWVFAAIAALGGLLGWVLQQRMVEKRLSKLPEGAGVDRRYAEVFAVFLLTTSVPQIPSILATFCFTFGASIVPVVAAITLCSVGVVAQALRVPKLAGEPE